MIIKALRFLNVLDSTNALSITNLSVWIVLGKLVMLHDVGLPEIGAFMIAMMNYGHKRSQNNKIAEAQEEEK
jgi:hypothetical protein